MTRLVLFCLLLLPAPAPASFAPRPIDDAPPVYYTHRPTERTVYILDDDSEVILDGKPVEWEDVPKGEVEIVEMRVRGRRIERIELRRKRTGN